MLLVLAVAWFYSFWVLQAPAAGVLAWSNSEAVGFVSCLVGGSPYSWAIRWYVLRFWLSVVLAIGGVHLGFCVSRERFNDVELI